MGIDWTKVEQAISRALAKELNHIGADIHAAAIARAPVRRVFKGGRRHNQPYEVFIQQVSANVGMFVPRGHAPNFTAISSNSVHSANVRLKRSKVDLWQPYLKVGGRFQQVKGAREVVTHSVNGQEHTHMAHMGMYGQLSSQGRYELAHPHRANSAIYMGTLGGRLRRSIEMKQATADDLEVSVYTEVPYAKYVEFGTRRSVAQPFLRPALMSQRSKLVSRLRAGVKEGL